MEKISPGKELIERIKKGEILKEEQEELETDDYASKIRDGVEVVDVKAIPKGINAPEIDKRKSWDKI